MINSVYIHIPFCSHICTYCDFAKMYLFLLEKELFPEIETSFKTTEYLSTKYDEKNRIEEYLRRVFLLVGEQYVNDSEEYYRFNEHRK